MRKEGRVQTVVMLLLAVAVVAMSVGFAAYSQVLTINADNADNTVIKEAKWDVRYDKDTFAETTGTGYVAGTSHAVNTTGTDVSFNATLNKPGDKYEFTINAKNYGTFNAKLTSVTLSSLTAAQAKYVTYKVSVAGTEYDATTTGLNVALNAGASHPVKVTVSYVQPESEADLPKDGDVTLTLTASLNYDQA